MSANSDIIKDILECTLDDYVTSDRSMQQCLELAMVAARTDLPVLILGESGTGKTILARAIHRSSKRACFPFISFNVAALSDTLLESQLFGHEKGAFTSADRRVKGKFELANKGTIFLDEIADMSKTAQAKILRVVEYGEFERLGSEEIHTTDVRIISATHLPLYEFIESNKFRKDLFYRLSGISITIPPLRERPNDLKALVAAEIKRAAWRENKEIKGLRKQAAEILFDHNWPGNLRELNRVIHTAVAMTDGEFIEPEHILIDRAKPVFANNGAPTAESARQDAMQRVKNLSEDLSLRNAEIAHIMHVLELMGGNKRKTAKALGVSRSTLDRKLESIEDRD
ncbi:MAG: sigma-54-dependent Fis family transcriptional regulator [Candidatus Dadabacteria bacterium]|nr:MAG: sigma-54-dependent Fis family transcriptional regulator [Candidatus Dadabacteria bacterium]